jgi:hypothetical protein
MMYIIENYIRYLGFQKVIQRPCPLLKYQIHYWSFMLIFVLIDDLRNKQMQSPDKGKCQSKKIGYLKLNSQNSKKLNCQSLQKGGWCKNFYTRHDR